MLGLRLGIGSMVSDSSDTVSMVRQADITVPKPTVVPANLDSTLPQSLGSHGFKMFQQSRQKLALKRQQFSFSLIAALSQTKVVSLQVIEGGVDSVLFENFLYETVVAIRKDQALSQKKIILFMDNAVIHKHQHVQESIRKLKVNVLFNAQYSPWLNPIEQLFRTLKQKMNMVQSRTK